MATCRQALRRQRKLTKNNDRSPFVSVRMLLQIHHFSDEFSLHFCIHKLQLTKSASHTTELMNQVNQSHRTELVTLSVNAVAEVSIPLKMQEA